MTKIYVSGTPGTVIKSADGVSQGTIGSDGELKIKVPRDKFYAFMLSKSPGSDHYVPFALEYKNKICLGVGGIVFGSLFLPTSPYVLWASKQHDVSNGYRYIPSQTNDDLNIR